MGFIKERTEPDPDNFPGALYEIVGQVPVDQCKEAIISDGAVTWSIGQSIISNISGLNSIYIVGKKCTITASIMDDGTYDILSQTTTTITIDHTFIDLATGAIIEIHDSSQTYLTRNLQSFLDFIKSEGYAYTIKAGILYTNCPNPPLANACSTTFNPLT